MSSLTPCVYQEKCSGCQLWKVPYWDQAELKRQDFLAQARARGIGLSDLLEFEVVATQPQGIRNRLDFTWQSGNLGLYSIPVKSRKILDISYCAVLTAKLNTELEKLRALPWKFSKASLRLRESPSGQFGLWIDAANIEIKDFLSDHPLLKQLFKNQWIVEVGQKKKELDPSSLKLVEQKLRPWNETQFENQKIPLYGVISGFAQPSYQGQAALRKIMESFLSHMTFKKGIEFGSGNGNWSFPLLQHCQKLVACEQDTTALEGFSQSLKESQIDPTRVEIISGDFHRKFLTEKDYDFSFVNPARSGLKSFNQELLKLKDVKNLIYISCYPESFLSDALELSSQYQLKKIKLVDQFPQTKHYEIIALFERIKL